MLSADQVHTIIELIERQVIFFAGSTLGPGVLSDHDKEILKRNGVDPVKIYDSNKDPIVQNFHFGILSSVLGEAELQSMTFEELAKYVASGQNIPLSERELATIESIKMQSLSDIKSNAGRIFQDINNVVAKELYTTRANQEQFIRNKVIEGASARQSRKNIAREIAKLVGDWSRNFDKSVQYIAHSALNEGRAALAERRYGDNNEAKVYFQVQVDACDHCVKHYLTNGAGSEPKIFAIRELQINGSNIGRKVAEWKPSIHALHPACRCLLTEYIPGTEWNGSKFVFPKDKEYKSKINRPKVRIIFNGQEHYV